jgi:Lysylphosphatidylglycerol synthase TM region
VAFAPGLSEVRARLEGAQRGWLAVGVVLELLSCPSYVLMFRPIFCPRMSWRTSYQLAMSELAVGSLVPASGAAGLAFGAWALRKGGTPAQDIARLTVAFFVLKSAVNFVAVAVVGLAMWLGVGPDVSAALTLLPAALAAAAIAAVPVIPLVVARRGWSHRTVDALGRGSAMPDASFAIVTGGSSRAPSATGPSTTPSCGPACVRSASLRRSRSC